MRDWFDRPRPEPFARMVYLPEEALLDHDTWLRLKRRSLRNVCNHAEACILSERKLARHWAGAAGADKWEGQRYKRSGYSPQHTCALPPGWVTMTCGTPAQVLYEGPIGEQGAP